MITPEALADVRDAMERALADSDTDDRAQLLELVNRQIMDHVKFRDPGGEGLDGADGPERQRLNQITRAAPACIDHAWRGPGWRLLRKDVMLHRHTRRVSPRSTYIGGLRR